MHPNSSPLAEAERQLELQRQLILSLTPELYRQLALYLQVLRKGLLHSVQQACFHLATQTYPERFSAIGASRRLELQERLQALVQRCNCLLTVEQLMGLASQLQSRQQRQRRRDQQRLLLALAADHANGDDPGEVESEVDSEAEGQDKGRRPGDSGDSPFGRPRGSVHLGLDLPLSADLFGAGLEGLGSWLAGFATQGDPRRGDPELDEQDEQDQEEQEQDDADQDGEEQGEAPPLEPLSAMADAALFEPQSPDPIQASSEQSEDPGLDQNQGQNHPPLVRGDEPGRAAELDQASDPADQSGRPGDRRERPGLGAGDDQPPTSANGPAELDPLQRHGDGPDPDPLVGLPQEADRSTPPPPDPASPALPLQPPSSGAGQPPSPEGASEAPRSPRRPPFRPGSGRSGGRQRSSASPGPTDDFQFFQSLFAMAAEGLGRETPGLANPGSAGSGQAEAGPSQSGQGESAQGAGDASPDGPAESLVPADSANSLDRAEQAAMAIRLDLLRHAGGLGQASDPPGWQAQDSLLPQDAPSLLAWWEALDGALQRRLRNLSNAVNGELLRLGITRSHLPIALLDAVLKGQLDPLPAPANLVRLQMPFGGDSPASPGGDGQAAFPLGGPLEMVALLLRPTDLEFETPSLRVCRRRLEQNRARLRTMAQRHRYWQRRVQALEAERQWFQDSPNPQREPG